MKLRSLSLLLTLAVLQTACVKEDLSDCNNVTIYFEYLADGTEDVLYQYMDQVDLYVFDESNHILGSGTYGHDELVNFAAVPSFRLQPGTYRVVAVGNPYENTEVVNVTAADFDQIFIQTPAWGDGLRVTNHDHNYMGQHTFSVPESNAHITETVRLYSSHINMYVEIFGLPAPDTRADGDIPYQLSIEQSNAQTSFNNEINEAETGTLYPELTYDATRRCYHTLLDEKGEPDLALFRMDNGGTLDAGLCQHILVLTNTQTGDELVRSDLYNFITANEDKFDVTKQEATLPITIEYSSVGVSVTVSDWLIEHIKPEF